MNLVSSGDRRPHSQRARHPLKAKLVRIQVLFSITQNLFLYCMQMARVHLDGLYFLPLSLCLPQASSFTWKESIEIFSIFSQVSCYLLNNPLLEVITSVYKLLSINLMLFI